MNKLIALSYVSYQKSRGGRRLYRKHLRSGSIRVLAVQKQNNDDDDQKHSHGNSPFKREEEKAAG